MNHLVGTNWHEVDASVFASRAARRGFDVETCHVHSDRAGASVAEVYLRSGRPALMRLLAGGRTTLLEADDSPLLPQ